MKKILLGVIVGLLMITSVFATTVWEPGIALTRGDIITYNNEYYEVVQSHTTQAGWTPNIVPALFTKTNAPVIDDPVIESRDRDFTDGISVSIGDIITYNNVSYRVIQAHRTQSDWTPDIVPALFQRVADTYNVEIPIRLDDVKQNSVSDQLALYMPEILDITTTESEIVFHLSTVEKHPFRNTLIQSKQVYVHSLESLEVCDAEFGTEYCDMMLQEKVESFMLELAQKTYDAVNTVKAESLLTRLLSLFGVKQ